jgi:thiol-disulfide isomerase/thioredoxin
MTRRVPLLAIIVGTLAGCEDEGSVHRKLSAARAEVKRLEKGLPGGEIPELPWLQAPPLMIDALPQAPDGAVADLQQLRGKLIVLEFWATWCGPCRKVIPHWNELVESCKDDPIVFISVTNEDAAKVRAWIEEHPVSGWIGLDRVSEEGGFGQTAAAFGVRAIPHTVVIDQYGILVAHTRPELLTRQGLLHLNNR